MEENGITRRRDMMRLKGFRPSVIRDLKGAGSLSAAWLLASRFIGIACIVCVESFTPIKAAAQSTELQSRQVGSAPRSIESVVAAQLEVEALKKEELELVQRLAGEFPNSEDPIILMGNVYQHHGMDVKAVQFWQKALEANPKRADVHKILGQFAMSKGNYEDAISHWQNALEINPELSDVRSNIALALMGLGKTKEALENQISNIKNQKWGSDPRQQLAGASLSFAYFLLGQAYLQLEQYDKAKESYEMATKLQPDYTNAYYGLFTVCTRLNQPEKAKEYMAAFKKLKAEDMKVLKDRNDAYDDLISMRRRAAQTHAQAATLYEAQGNTQKAEELLKRAATLDPQNSSCLQQLASLYQMAARTIEALQMHKRVREIEPTNPTCHLNIGVLSVQLGQFAEAEEAFRTVIRLAPQASDGYRELALLYLRAGRSLPEAKDLAEKAVKLEPVAANYFVLSRAYDKNGDQAGALSAIKRAAELEPTNPRYRQMYELIRQRR